MYRTEKGFTLIELIVVIVLLGILGVTALGKFQDLSTDAQTAANSGIASELAAGSSINYAARLLNNAAAGSVALNAAGIDCATLVDGSATALLTTLLPTADYTVSGTADCAALGAGGTFSCSVIGAGTPTGVAANATIICTP